MNEHVRCLVVVQAKYYGEHPVECGIVRRRTGTFFLLVLMVFWPLMAGATAFSDCGYYKLPAEQFAAALDAFADDVQAHIQQNPQLRDTLIRRGNITQNLYDAGLIERVPGCIQDPAGFNVEVVGGDPLGIVEGPDVDASGFSLVVRGLPQPLCREVQAQSGSGRPVRVRPEPPGQAPGVVGECVSNPITWAVTLGRTLPMPNTAYVYQRIALPAPVANPLTGLCPIDPADQLALLNVGEQAPCMAMRNANASAEQKAQCEKMTAQIRTELNHQQQNWNAPALAAHSVQQRLDMIRPLFVTFYTPPDPDLLLDRQRHLIGLYVNGPEHNVDPDYWNNELKEYDRIAEAIRKSACDNRWEMVLEEPAIWKGLSQESKARILYQIYEAFKTIKPIQLKQFAMEQFSLFDWRDYELNGFYIPPAQGKYGDQYRDSIIIKPQGFHLTLAGGYVSLQHALETVLEELMHAHQHELKDQYMAGELARASHACDQAALFLYNSISPANDPEADIIARNLEALLKLHYSSQPLEYHAKKFATHTMQLLLAGAKPQCR